MTSLFSRAYWSVYTARHLLGQARYPFRPMQRIARDRDRRVRHMVGYAYRWVPYYRETLDRLGLTPGDFHCFEDLELLPLISATDLQRDGERFRSRQFSPETLVTLSSSGSTGRPHEVYYDLGALYQNAVQGEREKSIFRRLLGKHYRTLSIASSTGSGLRVRRATREHAFWPHRADVERNQVDDYAPYAEMRDALNHYRPDLLNGYGSTLSNLFVWLERSGEPCFVPGVLRYASDALSEALRHELGERYGVACYSGYQTIEAFKIGFECAEHLGYHLNDDLYPVRIVDAEGQDLPAGEPGEVVVSNLINRGTVLLNYRLGDRARLLDRGCPCGRHLPLLSYVEGRTVDDLYDTSGGRQSYAAATAPILKVQGVYQYQVTQFALDRLRVDLLASADCDRAREEPALIARVRQRLGDDMQIEVRFVDEIERTAAGKVRYVRNLVAEEEG